MVTTQRCGRKSGSLNPRLRAYYLFIYKQVNALLALAGGWPDPSDGAAVPGDIYSEVVTPQLEWRALNFMLVVCM